MERVIGVTSHSEDLAFDLGDGAGSVTYSADTGLITSNVEMQAGLEPDNFEVRGPIGDTVSLVDLLGGRFNNARAWLFQVNHRSLGSGALKIMGGDVIDAKPEGGAFVFEVHNDFHRFNSIVGNLITTNCKADFGDPLTCRATPIAITGTVTAVTDAMRFTVSFTGSYANAFFDVGTVDFLTGDLANVVKMMIFHWTAVGAIELFMPLVKAPAIGDTLTIAQGCGKARADCIARGNMINFYHGYPDTPGTAQVLKVAVEGMN
jgi:uncharacterized phage protein (TIGR02218 family)